MKKNEILSVAIGFGGLLIAAAALTAGPLDPPAGTIAPTYKTLTEVEPRTAINLTNTPGDSDSTFKITQPGSYYLTQNHVTRPGAFIGIEIAASNVTIDLNGFMLSGGGGAATRPGIHAGMSVENITIRNGTIMEYQATGVELFIAANTCLENLTTKACSNGGYRVNGAFRISRCIAISNSVAGFVLSGAGTIQDSVANLNGGVGFQISGSASAISCNAVGNTSKGFELNRASLTNCTATNSPNGIQAYASTLVGCVAASCTENGFFIEASTATTCTAMQNNHSGFRLSASAITQCLSNNNGQHGVTLNYDSVVRESTFTYNGTNSVGAGIYITGDGNRIEGNNCGYQDIGIDADASGNFIARNTCRGNSTNWSLVTGNICFVVSASPSGAINGSSGGSVPGSTDPNANFSY
jgi:hypothetical protein